MHFPSIPNHTNSYLLPSCIFILPLSSHSLCIFITSLCVWVGVMLSLLYYLMYIVDNVHIIICGVCGYYILS